MLTGGNRSIKEITRDLEQIPRQRRCVRIFHADQHAGEITGCVEKLKMSMNSFVVSDDLSTSKIYLRLIAVTGGKRGNARDQSRGRSGGHGGRREFAKCLHRKCEQICGRDFKIRTMPFMWRERPRVMPLRCVDACGDPSTLPEHAGGMSEWQYREAFRTLGILSMRRERSHEELSRSVERMAIPELC